MSTTHQGFSAVSRAISSPIFRTRGGRSILLGGVVAFVAAAALLVSGSNHVALARGGMAAHGGVYTPSTPFLTLPFTPTEGMNVLSGWYYSGGGGFHGGIDFINGGVNRNPNFATFPVIASADGLACGNCTSRQGNAVWIKHNVNGVTYYTYYGHLASIASNIPIGSQSRTVAVKRGQVIGMAGDTGAPGVLHLHFGLYNANSQPLDPFSIGRLRQYYPKPDQNQNVGWFIQEPTE